MRKLFKFLFEKPKIKKGEKMHYYDKTCMGIYFNWKYGLWFIETDDGMAISCGLEEFYRKNNKS